MDNARRTGGGKRDQSIPSMPERKSRGDEKPSLQPGSQKGLKRSSSSSDLSGKRRQDFMAPTESLRKKKDPNFQEEGLTEEQHIKNLRQYSKPEQKTQKSPPKSKKLPERRVVAAPQAPQVQPPPQRVPSPPPEEVPRRSHSAPPFGRSPLVFLFQSVDRRSYFFGETEEHPQVHPLPDEFFETLTEILERLKGLAIDRDNDRELIETLNKQVKELGERLAQYDTLTKKQQQALENAIASLHQFAASFHAPAEQERTLEGEKINQFGEQLRSIAETMQGLVAKVADLSSDKESLKKLEASVEGLSNQMKTLTGELHGLGQKQETSQQVTNQAIGDLNKEFSNLEKQIGEFTQSTQLLLEDFKRQQEASVTGQKENTAEQLADLYSKMQQQQAAMTQLTQSVNEAQAKQAELVGQLTQSQAARLDEQNRAYEQRFVQNEQRLQEILLGIQNLTTNVTASASNAKVLEELQKTVKGLADEMGKLTTGLSNFTQTQEGKFQAVTAAQQATDKQVGNLKQIFSNLEQEIGKITQSTQLLLEDFKRQQEVSATGQKEKSAEQLADLTSKMQQQQAEMVRLTQSVNEAQAKQAELVGQLTQAQTERLEAERKAYEVKFDQNAQELQDISKSIQVLTTKVAESSLDKAEFGKLQESVQKLSGQVSGLVTSLNTITQSQEGQRKLFETQFGEQELQGKQILAAQQATDKQVGDLKQEFSNLEGEVKRNIQSVQFLLENLEKQQGTKAVDKEESARKLTELTSKFDEQKQAMAQLTLSVNEAQAKQAALADTLTAEQAKYLNEQKSVINEAILKMNQTLETVVAHMQQAIDQRISAQAEENRKIVEENRRMVVVLRDQVEQLTAMYKNTMEMNRELLARNEELMRRQEELVRRQEQQLQQNLEMMQGVMVQNQQNRRDPNRVENLTYVNEEHPVRARALTARPVPSAPRRPESPEEGGGLRRYRVRALPDRDLKTYKKLEHVPGWLEAEFWKTFLKDKSFWMPVIVAAIAVGFTVTLGSLGMAGPIILGLLIFGIILSIIAACGYAYLEGGPFERIEAQERDISKKRQDIYDAYKFVSEQLSELKKAPSEYLSKKRKPFIEGFREPYLRAINSIIKDANERKDFEDLLKLHYDMLTELVLEGDTRFIINNTPKAANLLAKLLDSKNEATRRLAEQFSTNYPVHVKGILNH